MSVTAASAIDVAKAASLASRTIAVLSAAARNDALTAIHSALKDGKDSILKANARDVERAMNETVRGAINQSVLKRLDLARKGKWEDMLQGILDVRDLEDPVGKVTLKTRLDEGLILERVTCPIGVLLVIFEARPEIIANIAALAIKSGNAAILKGGSETTESFIAISTVISSALSKTEVSNASIQLVINRKIIWELVELDEYIDLVIPRGSNEFVRTCKRNSRIPVLGHADGLCSIYIHADADPHMAAKIILDAKLGYPAACNSIETLLVDEAVLTTTLSVVVASLLANGVTLRCDASSKAVLSVVVPEDLASLLEESKEEDYTTEFLDLVLAIKTIPSSTSAAASVDIAIAHVNSHSSKHTDTILTSNRSLARRFQTGVDSACVFWNTSTRMSDGMRFGFGTEVGVSTNKIHARGPVGLEGLTIYKYFINGDGHVAGDYFEGEGGKKFIHEELKL